MINTAIGTLFALWLAGIWEPHWIWQTLLVLGAVLETSVWTAALTGKVIAKRVAKRAVQKP